MTEQEMRDQSGPSIVELGAASELTRGIWDPVMMENHLTPESRDF